jgi:hypothetical protein
MRIAGVIRIGMVILATGLALHLAAAEEESTWDAYVPRALAAIITQHESDASKTDRYFTSDNFPSRIKVLFLGKKRSLPRERGSFLDQYFKTVKQPEFRKYFKSEVLVREGTQDYWLPIQGAILPAFENDVKPQTEVEVFVTWLGATRIAGKLEWIFTINEFEATESQ